MTVKNETLCEICDGHFCQEGVNGVVQESENLKVLLVIKYIKTERLLYLIIKLR
jgi:hypothetical protein